MGRIIHFNDLDRSFVPFSLVKVMVEIFTENDNCDLQYKGTAYFNYRKDKETFDNEIQKYFNDEVRYIFVEDGLLHVCLNHYE